MDNETVALDAVRQLVWSGFYDADEIVTSINETIFWQNEIDQHWLRAEIQKEFRRKRAEEETWPGTTVCDQLDQAFALLERQGILALQNAGYTQSDGISDVTQFYHDAGGEQSD